MQVVRVNLGAQKAALLELPVDNKQQPPMHATVQHMIYIGEKKEVWVVTSGSAEGLIVYDVTKRERRKEWVAHDRKMLAICRVGNEVWTGGLDTVIKVWSIEVRTFFFCFFLDLILHRRINAQRLSRASCPCLVSRL